MCGIFAYIGHQLVPITQAIQVLRLLETEQETNEPTPVGGHGAGIAYLNHKHEFTLAKVGKTQGSPVNNLQRQLPDLTAQSTLILGHVRRASPEFTDTISHPECTQPYKPQCMPDLNILSAHNGKIQNYKELKNQLAKSHKLESQEIELIDSEVIPHLFEELLSRTTDTTKAIHTLFDQIEGTDTQGNTIVVLYSSRGKPQLHAIQKGKSRGLTIWTNPKGETLLCSRKKPIQTTLAKLLKESNYQQIIHVTRNDSANLEAHLTLTLNQHTQTSR